MRRGFYSLAMGIPISGLEDRLPEETPYRDDGCDLSPSCLRCPLPRCRYDDPQLARSLKKGSRDRSILALSAKGGEGGMSVGELAARYGLSRRSIYRILKGGGP